MIAGVLKWLIVALVAFVVGALLFGSGRRSRPDAGAGSASGGRRRPALPAMVPCAHCGVHLPIDEAVLDGAQRTFCCDAHRIAGPR